MPTDLAPSQCFGGCRGVSGPFPQPLFIRVSVYSIFNSTVDVEVYITFKRVSEKKKNIKHLAKFIENLRRKVGERFNLSIMKVMKET
jgi:hypothetical protein